MEEIVLSDMVVYFHWVGISMVSIKISDIKTLFDTDFTNCLILIIQSFERTCKIVSLILPCFRIIGTIKGRHKMMEFAVFGSLVCELILILDKFGVSNG